MDVATLVKSITSCFEDAAGHVRRIRDKPDATNGDDPALQELIESLELGPVVVNGYYHADAKRFGASYTSGDALSTDQLKDILIHLQMTVLTTLSTVLMLDKEVDYTTIQAASDDSRVNTGVCLGQLSQRLANPARAQQYSNHVTKFPFSISLPPLQHSRSMSSHSSDDGPRTPTTPELEAAMADLDYPGRLPGFFRASDSQEKAWAVMQGGQSSSSRKSVAGSAYSGAGVTSWATRKSSMDEAASLPKSQPSSILSTADDRATFSPVSPASTFEQWNKPSPFGGNTRTSGVSAENRMSQDSREPYGPDDYPSPNQAWRPPQPAVQVPQPRYRLPSFGHESTGPQIQPSDLHPIHRQSNMPREPIRTIRTGSESIPIHLMASRSNASIAPIPVTDEEMVPRMPTPPLPSKSPKRGHRARPPIPAGALKILGDVDSGVPQMPTEDNMMGYCKGAFRLQIGLAKKAFSLASRPAGMMGYISYWKCEKCHFEGPMRTLGGSSKKTEKIFDPSIREHDGIRFRWAFLAKCHVPLKFSASRPDGFVGSFGCIFCTAEAKNRNWNIASMSAEGKGRSASRPIAGAATDSVPIFGNPALFLEHLQMHRQMNYWPGLEMQKKLKCVVGRVAAPGEEFDINLMPLEVEMEA